MISTFTTFPLSTSTMNSEKERSCSDFVCACRTTCHNKTAVTISTTQKSNVLTVEFKEASKTSENDPNFGSKLLHKADSCIGSHDQARNLPNTAAQRSQRQTRRSRHLPRFCGIWVCQLDSRSSTG